MTGARVVPDLSSTTGDNKGEKARPPITGVGAPRAASNPLTERGLLVIITPQPIQPDVQPRRHWYVDSHDYPGYCAACSLPPANGRHVGRTA